MANKGDIYTMAKVIKKLTLDRLHEIEIEKVFDSLITIQNQRIQAGIFFGTFNLGALSIAFTAQKAGLIILASLLLWAFILIDFRGRAAFARMQYRSLQLKDKFASDDDDSFLNIFIPQSTEMKFREINKIKDREKRLNLIRSNLTKQLIYPGFWAPILASLIEIMVGVTLWLFFQWKLF